LGAWLIDLRSDPRDHPLDKVALARVVLTNREHVMALEARDKGLMGMLLHYPYEVRDASEYFDDIHDV
jgi:DNA end-binding protein Ku